MTTLMFKIQANMLNHRDTSRIAQTMRLAWRTFAQDAMPTYAR